MIVHMARRCLSERDADQNNPRKSADSRQKAGPCPAVRCTSRCVALGPSYQKEKLTLRWHEFKEEAPDLACIGLELLNGNIAYLATTKKDVSP